MKIAIIARADRRTIPRTGTIAIALNGREYSFAYEIQQEDEVITIKMDNREWSFVYDHAQQTVNLLPWSEEDPRALAYTMLMAAIKVVQQKLVTPAPSFSVHSFAKDAMHNEQNSMHAGLMMEGFLSKAVDTGVEERVELELPEDIATSVALLENEWRESA